MIEFPLGMSLGRPYSFHLIFLRLKIANKKSRTWKNQVRLYTKCPALVVVVRTYFLHMYNDEKNEPELYIKTLADKREPYHPELFFSTAQLNTVALSSFLSRALSLTEIPIGTIVIDDPVGHFDDMNILGFADLMRSIIEKSQKQIVITTHDETVYQIFRRKLPPEIYSSRFIDMTAE